MRLDGFRASSVRIRRWSRVGLAALVLSPLLAGTVMAQGRGGRGAAAGASGDTAAMDMDRARRLYVSARPEDHPPSNYEAAIAAKARTDSIYRAQAAGAYEFSKVTYRSSVGDLDIPAYVFQPLQKRGARGHPALVWVHGGVHSNWTPNYLPFVKEAVARGYVVIAPDYRGSTGYGKAFHEAIDYGGYEVEDVISAHGYLARTLPHVDSARVAVMGWSHGGLITALATMRETHPFTAGVAIVPVSNLIFRLSYKGPGYQRSFATMKRVQGLPFEKREEYVARSPVYQVDRLNVPLLVHIATNDTDVDFVEAEMLVNALRVKKPELAETKIYVDPTPGPSSGGHTFSRRVNSETLQRDDSPEQRDSWNRVWAFLEWNLRPYETAPRAAPPK